MRSEAKRIRFRFAEIRRIANSQCEFGPLAGAHDYRNDKANQQSQEIKEVFMNPNWEKRGKQQGIVSFLRGFFHCRVL